MAQPTVQSVEQIIADYTPAYADSIGVIDKRRAALPGQFQAQRMGLEAEKVQGFNQINNQATGRGMSFSGVPLHEQANYLSTKFLPGMQQLTFQENDANLALDDALAQINKERRLTAMDVRTQQQSSLEKYLSEERQMAWDREKFNAEMALQRQSLAAKSSGGGGGGGGSASNSGYYTRTNQVGGTNFYDGNGNPVTAAQYFAAQGGNAGDLKNFLGNSPGGQAALQYWEKNGLEAAKQKFHYVFGGI